MYLQEDPDGLNMQIASHNPDVQKIVNHLLFIHKEDWDLFRRIANFLYWHTTPERVGVVERHLQGYIQSRPGPDGSFQVAPYYNELIQQLTHIYEQEETDLGYLRGAIVELFTHHLVSRHCDADECFNNHFFRRYAIRIQKQRSRCSSSF